MKIISYVMEKGGVGKTTIAHNVAYQLSQTNQKVLLLDMDKSAVLTRFLGFDDKSVTPSVYEALCLEQGIVSVIRKLKFFDFVPTSTKLVAAETFLNTDPSNNYIVAEFLDQLDDLEEPYDYVIIDCPGNLDKLTGQVILASDEVTIVYKPEEASFGPLRKTIDVINNFNKRGAGIKINGLVANMVKRTSHHKDMLARTKVEYGEYPLYIVRDTIKVVDAAYSEAQCIAGEFPSSSPARAIKSIVEDMING